MQDRAFKTANYIPSVFSNTDRPFFWEKVEREDVRPKDMKKDTSEFLEDKLELEALLSTFKSALQEVRSRIGPLLKEVTISFPFT